MPNTKRRRHKFIFFYFVRTNSASAIIKASKNGELEDRFQSEIFDKYELIPIKGYSFHSTRRPL